MKYRSTLFGMIALSLTACGEDAEVKRGAVAFEAPADGLPTTCHPFRTEGVCGVPYPSSIWQVQDASTATGYRLDLPSELVAASAATDAPFDPTRWNERDGFSPATPIVAYFEEKLDPASLPGQAEYDQSLAATSATLIVDMESNQPVAHFSELDQSADIEPTERQPLMLRPARHLRPNHRYAVAITRSLKALDGGEVARPVGFQSALDGGQSSDPAVQSALDGLDDALVALEAAGVAREDLILAWEFRTASLEQSTRNVIRMRDQALAKIGQTGLGFTIESVELDPANEIHKRIRGKFVVPSFLTTDDRSIGETYLVFENGEPAIQRDAEYPFELVIPKSALTQGPYPLLVYGHGLLGAADQVSSGHVRQFCNDKGYVCVGTDWIGFSEYEEGGIGQNAAAWNAVQDVNKLPWVGHRLQQAMVNFMAVTRTAKAIAKDPQALLPSAASALDDSAAPVYYGISQGGIMGASLVAYSPDLNRGVAQVGGSAYSLMIQRSVNWNQFFPAIRNAYPDRVVQQLVMALWQSLFDDSEGAGTAWAQGAHEPLGGTQKKSLLLQIAVGDSQVANLAAEIQARTMEIPLLSPSSKQVWGLSSTTGGVDNAIAFWDLVREPPPETNATPTVDNDVHGHIRFHPLNQQQTDVFLKTGKAENPCGGPCSFPGWTP